MAVDMRMTLDQIERLCLAAREVRDLGWRAPPGSRARRWRDLERRFDTELCDTSGATPALTPAGIAALSWAEQVLAAADELSRELISIAAGSRGEIDLVVSMMLASYRLPRVLASFSALHPDVRVRMHVADTDRALELVAAGHHDLALVSIQPLSVSAPLRATKLGDEPVLLVAAADSDTFPAVVSAPDLEHLPFVELDGGIDRRGRELRRAGVTTRQIVARLGHPEAIKAAVQAGLGVAMLPASAVSDELARNELRRIRVRDAAFSVPLCAVQREDVPPPRAAARRLLDYLARELR